MAKTATIKHYKESLAKMFSEADFKRYFDMEGKILTYEDLENINNISELLTDENMCAHMESLLDELTENQQEVIARRFGLRGFEKGTLEEVGREINLTRERVRQIQVEALKTLRTLLEGLGLTQEDLL